VTHVFEGEPDARQSADVHHKVSRFRPTYRGLTDNQKYAHDRIKRCAAELELAMNESVLIGRELALAMTKLEESVMWVIKGLTGDSSKV